MWVGAQRKGAIFPCLDLVENTSIKKALMRSPHSACLSLPGIYHIVSDFVLRKL